METKQEKKSSGKQPQENIHEKKATHFSKKEKNSQTKNNQEEIDIAQEVTEAIKDIVEEKEVPKKGETVTILENGQLLIGEKPYALVKNYREGFDVEALGERFSDVLARYDYIVGDWGYEQLRLKGFFDNDNKRAFPDQKIATLQDYLYEYCNFGCRYFVIEKMNKKKDKGNKPKRKKKKPQAYIEEKVQPVKHNQPVIHRKKTEKVATKEEKHPTTGFTIRKREE